MFTKVYRLKMVNQSYLNTGRAGGFHVVNECEISDMLPSGRYCIRRTCRGFKTCLNYLT